MKKFTFLVLSNLLVFAINAQLSLTKAFNEPVIGDVNRNANYDTLSISALPNTTGTNQWWDFSAITSKSVVSNGSYDNVSSTPHGSNFPSATMAYYDGAKTYSYYKATPTQLEIVGLDDPDIVLNYTNTAIAAIWPISLGYKTTDVFAGNAVSGSMTDGVSNGTITVWATGSGTLVVPGGQVFEDVLQLRTSLKTTARFLFGLVTATLNAIQYDYYHASQKFPIVSVTYSNIQGSVVRKSAGVKINNNVMMVGLSDAIANESFIIYPNPSHESFNIKFMNRSNDFIKIELLNTLGVIVKSHELNNLTEIDETISIADIPPGLYTVIVCGENKVSVRKLVIE